jgi:hypothetical protein
VTEAELKAYVLRIARMNGWFVHQSTQNRIVRPDKAGAGYPDLALHRDGEAMWFELKTEDGMLSPAQYQMQVIIGKAYHVIRPKDLDNGRLVELLA